MVSSDRHRPLADDETVPSLYEVTVEHHRRAPVRNSFRYRSYMWLFDLDRPPKRLLSRYRRQDHLDVAAELARHGLEASRIWVMTNLRVLGYVFNPISIYWCYRADGQLSCHVAEVHNVYGGRHAYVLPADGGHADRTVAWGEVTTATKVLPVSPFYPLDGRYRIRISEPGETVSVSVVLDRPDDEPFFAVMTGRRQAASLGRQVCNLIRYPAAPLRGRALIQYQGIRLWHKGLEVKPR